MPAFLHFYQGAITRAEFMRLTWREFQHLNDYRLNVERQTQQQIAAMRGG